MWLCAVIYAVLFGWLTTALFQGRLLTFKKKIFCILQKLEVEKVWEHGSYVYVDCQVKDQDSD